MIIPHFLIVTIRIFKLIKILPNEKIFPVVLPISNDDWLQLNKKYLQFRWRSFKRIFTREKQGFHFPAK